MHCQQIRQQLQDDSVQNRTSSCTSQGAEDERSRDTTDEHNAPENADLCDAVQHDADAERWWAWQDSNLRPMDYESTALTN